jgi:hypothetical protein
LGILLPFSALPILSLGHDVCCVCVLQSEAEGHQNNKEKGVAGASK